MAKKKKSKNALVVRQVSLPPTDSHPMRPMAWSKQGTDETWSELANRLAVTLADLDEDDFLIVATKRGNTYFQFSAQGFFGMRIEATSNQFLAEDQQLNSAADEVMRAYGWAVPTYIRADIDEEPSEGSPNYYMDLATPLPFQSITELFVATMRNVYGVRHPTDLSYKSFNKDNTPIRHPTLGLMRKH